ncbi:sortase domain-bontaining protein [Streptomyces sp. NPDC059928]|uniref:sortase domain-containing protein n=1 Tax=unclassified Streptomyces TaxID=2593676 RepID=UPI003659AAD6
MSAGDTIEVGRAGGSTAVFKIRESEQVDKKDFPLNKVYGTTDRPELRLITCGGPISRTVTARPTSSSMPTSGGRGNSGPSGDDRWKVK